MDILTVDQQAQASDIDAQNAVVVWIQALINKGPYATLDDAKSAIVASDLLASIQVSLTTAKAAIPAPVVPTPPIQTPVDPGT